MPQSVSVLLLDDGELDDVQEMLESMRIPFGRVRGASIVSGMRGPTDLLIATPRRVEAVREVRDATPETSAPVRIVVADEDSTTLRDRLRRGGFDFIVRRPVHPEALRLLILHALYTGEERRTEPRAAMGFEVGIKSGLIARRATLADLSTRGCRLLTRQSLEKGRKLKIQLPEALGATEPIPLRGQVVRAQFDEHLGEKGLYSVGVVFEKVSNAARQELEWIIEARSRGPARLNEGEEMGIDSRNAFDDRGIHEIPASNLRSDPRFEADELDVPPPEVGAGIEEIEREEKPLQPAGARRVATPERTAPAADPRPESEADERRRLRRASFASKVPAFGNRALRVLVGRDLSVRGMRVEASPDLEVGDRLHLAIYGEPDREPFLVWATVARDDGEKGIAIDFDELHPLVSEQLEKLVLSLPAVESLHDGEAEAMGTVVSEVLTGDDD